MGKKRYMAMRVARESFEDPVLRESMGLKIGKAVDEELSRKFSEDQILTDVKLTVIFESEYNG